MADDERAAALRERIERLHRSSVEATDNGRPALAARRLRQALARLGWSATAASTVVADHALGRTGWDDLLARLLTSLAHAEAELGRTELGLSLLDEAQRAAPPPELAIVHAQRGLLLLRLGSNAEALRELDLAAPMLLDHDRVELARVLLNRSVIHLSTGRIRQARDDAQRSAQIAHALGHDVLAAKALHNDGYCDLLLGDVPAALSVFARVEPLYREASPGFLPVLALDRARALLAVGLTDEAGRTLDQAIDGFRRQRLMQDYAEAELARAQCALDAGRAAEARDWARRAESHFWRRGSTAWALRAALMRLRGDFAQATAPGSVPLGEPARETGKRPAGASRTGSGARVARPGAVAARAAELSGRFAGLDMPGEAEMARLVSIRALIAAGRLAEAATAAAASPAAHGAPLDVRLMRHLATAELAGAHGQRGRALRKVRSGLALVHSHRGRLGSLDMLTGVTALGADLAAYGLTTALAGGSARHVFAWSERCRAQAFRYRPPHAPEDEQTAEALAELRQLAQQMHADEAAGLRSPALRRRCLELEQLIRERGWQLPGVAAGVDLASTGAVEEALAADDSALVSLFTVGGALQALVLVRGRCHLHELSAYEPVAEAARRLAGDLNAQAGRNLRPAMKAVIEASAQRQLGIIEDAVLAPLSAGLAGARGIVLVPTMALSAVPWGLLPGLRGRPLVVAPSALVWLSARRAREPYVRDGASSVLVAGPDLDHADTEVEQLGAVHPKARRLRGGLATVSATLAALDGASFAHFAAHGHHERENVLFSRLDLADGPLMAYDLQRLGKAPGHVVLSACDVGQAVVRAGDELLGFTAALLYLGTSTVISSLTRVPDSVAEQVMMAYHRDVALGVGPADALAAASAGEPAATFVCFGAG